ncbi:MULTISPECIES: SDR family NAD(P)-dependent oxidoreductase [unclassified Microbacterium]|uniref:SDR family NAD(P)-dependent oxidoreductase n=1 Tax=unclassified Microbacterium TaxID=2609290 RepID=UPI001604C185|nr:MULTISPECIES: SDR family oxidoreductase [unclassified Microbacterium]QNA91834.1 SDR family oxidoreductase [Microbacterium sp. Se63.02b]QYM65044.1 SDR family oxidoreductase [Microbacterium sp. Se5.02b]
MSGNTIEPLLNRVAVVTGGARGLGYAMAEALAAAGADVALLDRLDAVGDAATALQSASGRRCIGVTVDVTDEQSVAAAFDAVAEGLGVADVLVNSAGITLGTPLIDTAPDDWRRVLDVNVTGTFVTSREFARRHIGAARGNPASLVNVSSMSAFAVNIPQTQAAYNTSKAAVSMFTKSAAIEWWPHGIRVNAIAPGYFASDMTRDFVAENPEMAEDWVRRIPAGRMGEPEELGDLLVYLASERSSYVVGQSILIDGGYTSV